MKQNFESWLKLIKREQRHYKSIRGVNLDEKMLMDYYDKGWSPIDTLNDIITAC